MTSKRGKKYAVGADWLFSFLMLENISEMKINKTKYIKQNNSLLTEKNTNGEKRGDGRCCGGAPGQSKTEAPLVNPRKRDCLEACEDT